MHRRVALAALLLLLFPAGGAARVSRQTLFEFGRGSGNIEPYTVQIRTDGTLFSEGDVKLAKPQTRLTQARLAALLSYARRQHFWSLGTTTFCSGSLPDFATNYVSIHSAGKVRTVRVRGGCVPRFTRIYNALSAAATVKN